MGSQSVGRLWLRLQVAKSLRLWETGCFLYRLWVAGQQRAKCNMVYRWQGQTKVVISETRGKHGLPPLGVCGQGPHVAPEVRTESDTATEQHSLMLSLP